MTKKSILNVSKNENVGTVNIYGEIVPEFWRWEEDEESAHHFKDVLAMLGDVDEIIVNINSPGGSVFEGLAIYNMLKRHEAHITVNVDGLAASIASVIAMAGDVIKMPRNAFMMVHNAMSFEFGNADELRETADLLDKITSSLMTAYFDKAPDLNEATLKALMDAETWFTAEEAKHYGLVDEVIGSRELVACADSNRLNKFTKAPMQLINTVETPKDPEVETPIENKKTIYYL